MVEAVIFDFYEIRYHGRDYHILVPGDIEQFWLINMLDGGSMWTETNFYGNRNGLKALECACEALAADTALLAYFPCKKNQKTCEISSFFHADIWHVEAAEEFLDLVLMKPGTLKISEWKGIRACLAKTEAKKRRIHAAYVLKNRKVKEKYQYRREKKEVIRFDTLFYNFPYYDYLAMASWMNRFLNGDREKDFLEDIENDGERLRGEGIWFLSDEYNVSNEVWVSFWDNDIWRKEQLKREKRREQRCWKLKDG